MTLCSLLRRELHRQGIERSRPALLDELGQIREVCRSYPATQPTVAPEVRVTLTEMSESQRALYDALDLGRYRSP